jgi:putative transposase
MKPRYNFLKTVFSSVLKNSSLRLTNSYKKFFEGKGFPKFKSWSKQWFSLVYDDIENAGVNVNSKELTLSLGKDENGKKLHVKGLMKSKISYKGNYKLKTLTISKKQKKFYVSITIELEKKKEATKEKEKWIVIDPNHKNFFVSLDYKGEALEFNNPNFFKYFDKEIDYVKSMLDMCKKGTVKKIYDKEGNYVETKVTKASKRYLKLEKALFKLRHKKREQIKKLCFSIGHWLCKDYDFIGIGDYVPTTKTATQKNMHRSMLNQSHIGYLRTIVDQVAKKSHKFYKKLDERNTTKRCSFCGDHEKHLPDERIFTCKNCGKVIYRDINSCTNFAVNEHFILSGTDFVDLDLSKPTYTFNLNHKVDSIYNLVVKERQIKEKV